MVSVVYHSLPPHLPSAQPPNPEHPAPPQMAAGQGYAFLHPDHVHPVHERFLSHP